MQKLAVYILVFLFLPLTALRSQDFPPKPNPPRLVNDFTGKLTPQQVQLLENKLVNFDDTSSTQILVVLVKSFNGLSKEEYADQLGDKWGVGRKGKDNGIVVLIKPKYGNDKGEARISVGYGLEGAIPDAIALRIVDHDMIPYFTQGNYYEGIDKGTNTLMGLASGEFTADQYRKKTSDNGWGILVPIIIMIIIFIIMRGNSGRHYNSGSKHIPFWTALWLGSMMSGGSGGSSWGDFRSGGGSFGGGGGGGFGGFGGGGFGGGGAGGSW